VGVTGVILAALGGLFAVPVAHAAAGEASVMVVLDASGSMSDKLADGGTKMDVAKQAVHTLVNQVADGARLGLTVYGPPGEGRSARCENVRVVREVGPVDRDALNAAVDDIKPRGDTPIGQSLRTAASALPSDGPRSIVLVSDGQDTCAPPDPCEVADELAKQGVDLRIHVVGFDVDDRARQELTCIAQAGGGRYVDARDAGSLTEALNQLAAPAGEAGFWSNLTEAGVLLWAAVAVFVVLMGITAVLMVRLRSRVPVPLP
jgi:Ca-activated chloride channel family protein